LSTSNSTPETEVLFADEEMAAEAAQVSEALRGRYSVTERLGRGACGEVYKAQDTLLNRVVAIKRIRLDRLGDSEHVKELRARFLREAQVAARLQHNGIVSVYDVITFEDMSYLVMEYVEGRTLAQLLASSNKLGAARTVHLLSQVADALAVAHAQKVVHRDIKPANILVSSAGVAKISDFGVAKAESSSEITTVGSILGTPDYMSPEQARGVPVDGRADLFSLGCVLYECLQGTKPFAAPNLTGVLLRILSEEPAPIEFEKRGLPKELQPVLERSLAKDPAERFASAEEFAQALRKIQTSIPDGDFFDISERVDATGPTSSGTPDSVADSLMRDARKTVDIQPHLRALMDDERLLKLAANPLLHFRNVSLTSEEAFIFSRLAEAGTAKDIFSVSPLGEEETARALLGFLRAGLVEFESGTITQGPVAVKAPPSPRKEAANENRRLDPDEIRRLHQNAQDEDEWRVLGLQPGASPADIKGAFQSRAFRYHPDRYAHSGEKDLPKKLSYLFHRVSEAYSDLSGERRKAS